MRVLLVEDDRKLATSLRRGLEENLYGVDLAPSGPSALEHLDTVAYDLVILDLRLPGRDGLSVLRELRARGTQVPVLVLTARDGVQDKVQGLDAGADDYMTKPFSLVELLARIRALLRRGQVAPQPVLSLADLSLDPATHRVERAGDEIPLTAKEFALLEFFLRNRDRVLTRSTIAEHVWDYPFDNVVSNVIDVIVSRLRAKIDREREVKLLHTVKGVGYVLRTEP